MWMGGAAEHGHHSMQMTRLGTGGPWGLLCLERERGGRTTFGVQWKRSRTSMPARPLGCLAREVPGFWEGGINGIWRLCGRKAPQNIDTDTYPAMHGRFLRFYQVHPYAGPPGSGVMWDGRRRRTATPIRRRRGLTRGDLIMDGPTSKGINRR